MAWPALALVKPVGDVVLYRDNDYYCSPSPAVVAFPDGEMWLPSPADTAPGRRRFLRPMSTRPRNSA